MIWPAEVKRWMPMSNGHYFLLVASVKFVIFVLSVKSSNHDRLHDGAARLNDKTLLWIWMVDSATFGDQFRDFETISSVNNQPQYLYVKRTVKNITCAVEPEAINFSPWTRTCSFADFNFANFTLGLHLYKF